LKTFLEIRLFVAKDTITLSASGVISFSNSFSNSFVVIVSNLLAHWVHDSMFFSSFSFLTSMVFLYKLVRLDLSKSIAKRTLVYLLIFPTAFYFTMVYTESLFFNVYFRLFLFCSYQTFLVGRDSWGI